MQKVEHFFVAVNWKDIIRLRRWAGGGRQQEVKMSEREKTRRKWETERSLRPHNVCFLSVPSETEEGLYCVDVERGFSVWSCGRTASGATMLWSTTGRQLIKVTLLTSVSCSSESPIVWPNGSQACQNSDYCSQPSLSTFTHILNGAIIHLSSAILFLVSIGSFPSHSFLILVGFMSRLSTSSYLSTPWARQAHSPTLPKSVLLPVSAIFG